MKQKFKCTKNLVLDSQVIIMKHDVIEIIESDHIGDVLWFDINVLISGMCQDLELSIDIDKFGEHFEYLDYNTKYTICRNI